MVTIIGAGLAGLACARELAAHGIASELIEAADAAGGRVRTDQCDGFLLDRGFQVLLTAYPQCRRLLDYSQLKLRNFYPGALVRFDGKFHRLADPARHLLQAVESLRTPIGSLTDKIRIAALRESTGRGTASDLFARPETSTQAALEARHFSPAMVERFFRPFLGGIFLERALETSSRLFEFIFRMFAEGDTAIPEAGMQAIPEQLAHGLPIRFNTRVEKLPESPTVIATEEPEAARLLGTAPPSAWKSVECHYFAADRAPVDEPVLVLDGDGRGPVNNFCVESNVAPSYAPAGAALLSATVLGRATEAEVRAQMTEWFGAQVSRWLHLRRYEIGYAQPSQPRVQFADPRVRPGLYRCGDWTEHASIEGALASGVRTARALAGDV